MNLNATSNQAHHRDFEMNEVANTKWEQTSIGCLDYDKRVDTGWGNGILL